MRIIQAAVTRHNCRLQITVIQHAFSRFPIRIDERTDLILHLRVRQPRIIRNNLHIIHADLHTRTIQTSLMRRDNRTVLHRPQATHIIRIRGRRHTKGHGSSQYSRAYGHNPARHPPRFPQTCPAAHHRPFSLIELTRSIPQNAISQRSHTGPNLSHETKFLRLHGNGPREVRHNPSRPNPTPPHHRAPGRTAYRDAPSITAHTWGSRHRTHGTRTGRTYDYDPTDWN